jgi:hypothetical protein
MPHNHTLRIHIEYELLYVAEMRALLNDFERAYNLLERPRARVGQRISRTDRLIVKTVETGNSLTFTFLGGFGLLALAKGVKTIAEAREAVWKSEDAKWKAKSAKLDFQEREASLVKKSRQEEEPEIVASEIIQNRIEIIERTQHITSLEMTVDNATTKLLAEPKK